MKAFLTAAAFVPLLSLGAMAGETVRRFDDASLYLEAGLGKQVHVRFSEAFAKDHLEKAEFEVVVISELPLGKVCLFGQQQGLDPASSKLADVARAERGDICVLRSDVSAVIAGETATGAPLMPFYSTDKANCVWSWKTGKGIGLWTEDCRFDTGRWDVAYDEAGDLFALRVDGGDPYPVLRQFRIRPGLGPESLLPELKAKGLVLNDPDCLFDVSPQQVAPPGWVTWQVFPVGTRKDAFEAQPKDEVPEPPCGELGLTVDSTAYFAMNASHPDRVIYVNLGQDGTMIDPASITFN